MPILAILGLLWTYWSTFAVLVARWSIEPQYSHGFLVPVIAGAILWHRRGRLDVAALRPSWWGLPVLLCAIILRLGAAYYYLEWFDGASVVPCVLGACLLIGGWAALRWAWPAVLFLGFMLPLPYTLEVALASPLQSIATAASVFVLQTAGFPAVSEGHIILVDDLRIGVAEACSGLRMLVVFFAVATAVAIVVVRPLWERGLVVASAIPIALVCNITRIALTGILYETVGPTAADLVFHDLAGWLMMLMAIALLGIELHILSHLLIEPLERETIPVLPSRSWSPVTEASAASTSGQAFQHDALTALAKSADNARGAAATNAEETVPSDGAAGAVTVRV